MSPARATKVVMPMASPLPLDQWRVVFPCFDDAHGPRPVLFGGHWGGAAAWSDLLRRRLTDKTY